MVKLTNISGGQHVCDLSDGSTLRLDNGQSEVFSKELMTKHIDRLVSKGLFLKEDVKTEPTPKPTLSKKGKEETANGNV